VHFLGILARFLHNLFLARAAVDQSLP